MHRSLARAREAVFASQLKSMQGRTATGCFRAARLRELKRRNREPEMELAFLKKARHASQGRIGERAAETMATASHPAGKAGSAPDLMDAISPAAAPGEKMMDGITCIPARSRLRAGEMREEISHARGPYVHVVARSVRIREDPGDDQKYYDPAKNLVYQAFPPVRRKVSLLR